MINASLRKVLVCPRDKQPLWFFEGASVFYNERLGVVYEVKDSIAALLPESARAVTDDEQQSFATQIKAGNAIQTGVKE